MYLDKDYRINFIKMLQTGIIFKIFESINKKYFCQEKNNMLCNSIYNKIYKYKIPLISLISGSVSAISFYNEYFWPLIFFSLSFPFYYILKYRQKTFNIMLQFSFWFYFFADIWLLRIGAYVIKNKFLAFFVSAILLVLISFILSLMMSFSFLLYKNLKIGNNFINILILSFIYIFGEWIQEQFIPFAFPWTRLCNIVSPNNLFIQTSSIFGGLFISFLVILINLFFSLALIHRKKIMNFSVFFLLGICIYFANIIPGYILINLPFDEKNSEEVMLVQANLSRKQKWTAEPKKVLEQYITMTKENISDDTKIVIFPETALSGKFFDDELFGSDLYKLAEKENITIIFGTQYNCDGKSYNACAAIYPDGNHSEIYLKQVLVPFGEYNPFIKSGKYQFISNPFSHGTKTVLIETEAGNFGCGICFESAFPTLISKNVLSGAEAIVILTNDSWLGEKIPLYQHHSHSVLRAVENKKYVINCTNTGISSVISPFGETISESDINQENTLTADIKMNNAITLYSMWGDIIILPSCFIILITSIKIIILKLIDIKNILVN
ncbi:apolipoprotein N-acyltransferase [Porcipelethomonas sp.]|uniref:apolipoprotein N-acyltransferase n=1 Tax=Porcipelethomonas sp. TaxID=2981675 RepID=UPI003EF5CA08